jgi:hypothetical protein
MSADIVTFPGAALPDRPITESELDKLHIDAFRKLETNLRDCVRMSGIAAQLMFDAKIEDDCLRFAIFHTAEMLTSLEKQYEAGWPGEKQREAATEN